jgi:hypothetical protein
MNLAERIKARQMQKNNEIENRHALDLTQQISELGTIPYEKILDIVERSFDAHLTRDIVIIDVDFMNGCMVIYSNYTALSTNCMRIPKLWVEPVIGFLKDNGFKAHFYYTYIQITVN